MKTFTIRTLCAALATTACLAPVAHSEDIDLFTSAGAGAGVAPNILIIVDNSANWSRNDQAWPTGKQGESELEAIRDVLDDPSVKDVNLGLMMLTSGSPDGAYVRFAVRSMSANGGQYRKALQEMIGQKTCVDGPNSVTGAANCILKNFDSPTEKTNSASTRYSAALFEAYKYFGGYTDPAHARTDSTPSPYPVDRNHFGVERYAVLDGKADPGAYTDASKTKYQGPITEENACGKNFIIFIGNGYPSQDNDPTLLSGINGDPNNPAPIGNKSNRAANWAKYLVTTDVNERKGRQYIATYAIDVYNAKPDPDNQTPLLRGMSEKYGGGRYFAAKNKQDLMNALREVLIEIQSVNSVFASASLPINATNRAQNENQVYIGMFRPDGDAKPKWYGNLKQYQIAYFGAEAKLADVDGKEALAASTGFVQPCATSFWTTDSGNYWAFSPVSAGNCPTTPSGTNSDLPDGAVVEKGGAGEVLRKGNDPAAGAPFLVNRNMYTCSSAPCASLVPFTAGNVAQARTGAATAVEHTSLIDWVSGKDVKDENANANLLEPRPSIHGDIVHSRPLPVNFGGSRGVEIYYGTNDGVLRALKGSTGKELWSFVAPEHHSKLKRLYDNAPIITYPGFATATSKPKDYFFDGSAGVYQTADSSKVWIFPTMRRGGRMVYAFNISTTTPSLMWSAGCPNLADDSGCSAGFSQIGQTWSTPNVAFVKGFSATIPVLIMGGGYDLCEDEDSPTPTCGATKGNRVYVINGQTGALLQTFTTDRAVAADVTLLDRDFDTMVDHGYVADTGGNMYRIDFTDPTTGVALASGSWRMNKVARTTGVGRKFLFGPSALVAGSKVYLAIGTGDRERPLISNYPYQTTVQNRFYSFIDSLAANPVVINLDGPTMQDFTSSTDCNSLVASGKDGWFMNLTDRGEQVVTSSVIFAGAVFFSTNRPLATPPGSCAANLGEAKGYAVNLLNASGIIGSGQLCGGARSGVFTGGALPPSPVIGTVPVKDSTGKTKLVDVLIGAVNIKTGDVGTTPPIGAQAPQVPIRQRRDRLYWYPKGDL